MIEHLYDNYGIIATVDVEINDTKMRTEYDPALPIEVIFHQIEEAIEYATAGKRPYDPLQIISRAYLLILRIGLYPEPCKDLENKIAADKTWVNFKPNSRRVTVTLK